MSETPEVPKNTPSSFPAALDSEVVGAAFRELRMRGPELFFRVAFVGVFVLLVWPMLIPLVLGGLAAIVLQPLDERLSRRLRRAAPLSPAIVTACAVIGFLVPLAWVAWKSLAALNRFVASMLVGGVGATRDRVVAMLGQTFGTSENEQAVANSVDEGLRSIATALGAFVTSVAKALPQGITDTFLFVLALYFGLRDGPRLVAWARRVSPVTSRRTDMLFEAVRRSVHGTLVGMAVVSAVQGGLAVVALLVCRVDHALLWGFVAAICSVLPIVGTTPVTLGAATWLYLHDRPVAAIGMIAAAILIGVSDNVVRPWVQSQHDDVHPLVALVAIFGGLAIFGPSGLLFGPVLASMAVWAVETYRDEPQPRALAPVAPPSAPTE